MTEKQQKEAGVNITVNGDVAALSAGDNNTVMGTINLNASQQKAVTDLHESLTTLMQDVQKVDADFEIKSAAHEELKQIREHLANLEQATPETKSKLTQYLTNLKDGSLGAMKLLKSTKDSEETIVWAMEKAAIVGTFLAALPL